MRFAAASLLLFASAAADPAPNRDEIAVYRAVLAEPSCNGLGRVPGHTTLVVQREADPLTDSWWRPVETDRRVALERWFPQATPQEIQTFLQTERSARLLPTDALHAPGLITVDAAILSALGPGGDFWENFFKRYPGATGLIRLATVSVRPDQQRVFAYCGLGYGLLGGEGTLLLLDRTPTGWTVMAKQMLWES
jgi:hypothetical protein